MSRQIYLNLTNGLEALPLFKDHNYKVTRIQSTACEQDRLVFIISDLDNGFLFDLAAGKECIVVDFSNKHVLSRALWQGIPWIEYVLNRVWFDKETVPMVKGKNVQEYFNYKYHSIPPRILKKLKYFRKFLTTNEIKLEVLGGITTNDGDYEYFRDITKESLK